MDLPRIDLGRFRLTESLPVVAESENRPRKRRWLLRAIVLFAALGVVQFGANLWLQSRRAGAEPLHQFLLGRLQKTFGREVDVSYFHVNLLGRPRLEANYVTVAEDARFGREYFLRAERLTAGLRWRSLLSGRLEFGTISFLRPSLNLVRSPSGQWNLESWLPAPNASGSGPIAQAPPAPAPTSAGRIYRIEIDGGRVNFKRGADKHPFAFVDVNGTVEQEASGSWRLDVETGLLRAGVVLQEPGTLRVQGRIGGTAARLRPADLQIEWRDASLADMLRLARGQDYGVRGSLSLDVIAQSGLAPLPPEIPPNVGTYAPWTFRATARLRGVHRWDLPPRSTDPALNAELDAVWQPEQARVELTRAQMEAPGSNLRASGSFTWASRETLAPEEKNLRLRFTSGGIAVPDLFAWYRAFRPGVSDAAGLDGNVGLDVQLSGWPLQIDQAAVAVEDAELRAPGLARPITLSRALIRSERGALVLVPATLNLPAPDSEGSRATGTLRLEGKAATLHDPVVLNVTGQTNRVEDVLAAGAALGWARYSGWDVRGAANLKMRWEWLANGGSRFSVRREGTLDLRDVRIRPPSWTEPAVISAAKIEFAGPERRVSVPSAQVFGARWSGKLVSLSGEPWQVDLTAGRLDVPEILRWMTPAAPGGLLERVVGAAPAPGFSAPEAEGRLAIEQVTNGRLTLRRLHANVHIGTHDRSPLRFTEAQAEFYSGTVSGSLDVTPGPEPTYRFLGKFERVNLTALAAATQNLSGRFTGTASGELQLTARGATRVTLTDSLQGEGKFEVRGGEVRGLDLFGWASGTTLLVDPRSRGAVFQTAAGAFTLGSRKIQLEDTRFVGASGEFALMGSVDFALALDLRVLDQRRLPAASAVGAGLAPPSSASHGRIVHITGPWESPQLAVAEPPAPPPPQKAGDQARR